MVNKKFLNILGVTALSVLMVGCGKLDSINNTNNVNSGMENNQENVEKDDETSNGEAELVDISKFDSIDYGNEKVGSNMNVLEIGSISYMVGDDGESFIKFDREKYNKLKEEVFKTEYNDVESEDLDKATKDAIEKENEEFKQKCASENVEVKLCDEKCSFPSLHGEKIYLIKGTKVSTLDISTEKIENIAFLKDYDVEEMYVINGKVIYFRCGGNVYQADLENKSVFDLEKENIEKFFPSKYGIIYIDKEKNVYVDENNVIKNLSNATTRFYFSKDNMQEIWFTYTLTDEEFEMYDKAINIKDLCTDLSDEKAVEYNNDIKKTLLHCPN